MVNFPYYESVRNAKSIHAYIHVHILTVATLSSAASVAFQSISPRYHGKCSNRLLGLSWVHGGFGGSGGGGYVHTS